MSDFGCIPRLVEKTRKPHYCPSCGRTIPEGSPAYLIKGMWEGDWQNWYMCVFCHDNNVCSDDEWVDSGEKLS